MKDKSNQIKSIRHIGLIRIRKNQNNKIQQTYHSRCRTIEVKDDYTLLCRYYSAQKKSVSAPK